MAKQITLKITPQNCVDRNPNHLRVEKSVDREIVVVADAANPGPVTLTFNNGSARALFSEAPASGVQIQPGGSVRFTLKATPLGIERRAANARFSDDKEAFVRGFSFDTTPGRCGGGSHADIHVEC